MSDLEKAVRPEDEEAEGAKGKPPDGSRKARQKRHAKEETRRHRDADDVVYPVGEAGTQTVRNDSPTEPAEPGDGMVERRGELE